MEITELRIGNTVYYNGNHKEVGTVTGIVTYASGHTNINLNHRMDISYTLSEIQVIPLSEQILLDCGFEMKHKPSKTLEIKLSDKEKFSVQLNNVGDNPLWRICYEISGEMFLPKDKYSELHKLQNLYFALTNKELTINLKK